MPEFDVTPSKLRLSCQGLAQVDAKLSQLGWRRQSKCWAKSANVSVMTLRRFRARDRVAADSFQWICKALDLDWRSLIDSGHLPICTDEWVHRTAIFQALTERLQQGCRVMVITGITGIGKTVLAEQLTQYLQPQVGRGVSFNCEIRAGAEFGEVAAHCLEQDGQRITDEERQNPQQLMHRWLALLVNQPRWVVMDSFEMLLEGDEEQGWTVFKDPLWETFFHQFLGWESCQSQIILTSQDLPTQIQMQGLRYPQSFHVERLSGLSPALQAAFFQKYGFDPETEPQDWHYLVRIGAAYEGHPLALRVIVGEILERYGEDVGKYWQRYGSEIERVEATQAQGNAYPPRLDRYSPSLRRTVRRRIEDSFVRLRQDLPDAYLLLCLAATYREPVTEDFLLSPLRRRGCPEQRGQVALDMLLDRNLLEIDQQQRLRQHNLIHSVALDHLQNLN